MRIVEQNIRRHQRRVVKQTRTDGNLLFRLVLKLRHALKLTERANAAENPRELRVPDDLTLRKQRAFRGIEPARHVLREAGVGVFAKLGGNGRNRDGVLIRDHEKAGVIVLHFFPVERRAEIISEVETPGGLRSREHNRFLRSGVYRIVFGHNNLCRPS